MSEILVTCMKVQRSQLQFKFGSLLDIKYYHDLQDFSLSEDGCGIYSNFFIIIIYI